jgi:hypothetical protein
MDLGCAEPDHPSGVDTADQPSRGTAITMAADEKRDARFAGLMLGCIAVVCFALSALGMNY